MSSSEQVYATHSSIYVCMYVCIGKFITRRSYSLKSHECTSVGQTGDVFSLLKKNVSVLDYEVTMADYSCFGAQAAKTEAGRTTGKHL